MSDLDVKEEQEKAVDVSDLEDKEDQIDEKYIKNFLSSDN